MEVREILKNDRFYRNNSHKLANTSIELPAAIEKLTTGSDYWRKAKQNRYKKLIRDGHLNDLIQLAELAETKNVPANWFAKVASKAEWTRTLDFLVKLRNVASKAVDIAKRISVPKDGMKAVYKACWKLNDVAVKHAVTAAETGTNPFKYFNWLCWRT